MAVVLEGPDRAGKTTLAEILKYQFKANVVHLGGSQIIGGEMVRHWDKAEAEMKLGDRNTVYDRMVIGSLVYAFKHDKHNVRPVSPSEYTEWLAWMGSQRNLLVCCLPPLPVIMKRMETGEEYITRDDMVQVWRRYNTLFGNFRENIPPFPILFYDSNKHDAQDYMNENYEQFKAALL